MCDNSLKDMFSLSIKLGQSSSNSTNSTHSVSTPGGSGNNTRRPRGDGGGNQGPRGGGGGNLGPRGRGSSRPRETSFNDSPRHKPGPASGTQANIENVPVCMCGTPALLLTVRKEGPNQGIKALFRHVN